MEMTWEGETYLELVLANNSNEEHSCISRCSRNFLHVANIYSSKYFMHAQACKIIICSAGANAHNYYNRDYKLLIRQVPYLPYWFRRPCLYVVSST